MIKFGYKWLWMMAVSMILSTSVYADCSSVWNNPYSLSSINYDPISVSEVMHTNENIRLKTVTMSLLVDGNVIIIRINDSSIIANASFDVNNVATFNENLDINTDYRITLDPSFSECDGYYNRYHSFAYPVNDTNNLFTITKAEYTDDCSFDNWTDDTDNFYNILEITVENITNISCSECTYNCTYNLTNVSISYCYDNNTLIRQNAVIFNADEYIFYSPIYCNDGCDNITMTCNPPEYQQSLINGGIIIFFIIIFIIIFARWRRG